MRAIMNRGANKPGVGGGGGGGGAFQKHLWALKSQSS